MAAQIFLALGIKDLFLCPNPAGLTLSVACAASVPRGDPAVKNREQLSVLMWYSDVPVPFL